MKYYFLIALTLFVGLGFSFPVENENQSSPSPTIRSVEAIELLLDETSKFQVSGKTVAKPGDAVVLTPDNLEDARISWISFDVSYQMTVKDRDVIDTQGGKITFRHVPKFSMIFLAPNKGPVKVACVVTPNDQSKQQQVIVHTVEIEGEPDPDDEKGDGGSSDPKPDPKPNQKAVGGVLIIQEDDRFDEDTQALKLSAEWRSIQAKLENAFWIDADQPRAKKFLPITEAVGLPAILLFDEDNELISVKKLPKTKQGLMDLVK